uniref:Uncharacterized protein n=1 Tax=Ditylenchus dipsaci TaxID=166011 RepID=A0A915E135_9BILA
MNDPATLGQLQALETKLTQDMLRSLGQVKQSEKGPSVPLPKFDGTTSFKTALPLCLSGEAKAMYSGLDPDIKRDWQSLTTELGHLLQLPDASRMPGNL